MSAIVPKYRTINIESIMNFFFMSIKNKQICLNYVIIKDTFLFIKVKD